MAGDVHGRQTYVSVDTNDLSAYVDNVSFNRTGDSHDVTGMGADDHEFLGGLRGGQMQLSGSYKSGPGGPRDVLAGKVGATVEVVYRPEGTGTGKPEDTFDAILVGYDETSPVADRKQWAATFQITGPVTTDTQV